MPGSESSPFRPADEYAELRMCKSVLVGFLAPKAVGYVVKKIFGFCFMRDHREEKDSV